MLLTQAASTLLHQSMQSSRADLFKLLCIPFIGVM